MPQRFDPETIPPELIDELKISSMASGLTALVTGEPGGQKHIGLVIKRTYTLDDAGMPEVADPALQQAIEHDAESVADPDLPRDALMRCDDETMAFKPGVDLIIKGSAQTYGTPRQTTTVSVAGPAFRREITVYGERFVEIARDGTPGFTEAEPFETQALTADFAYGGYDAVAYERFGLPDYLKQIKNAMPDAPVELASPFHYHRNRAGVGYVIQPDRESLLAAEVPRLEFPFDPVTPDRMAVGNTMAWPNAPLPACTDYQPMSVFPRCAYMGTHPVSDKFTGELREVGLGWAPKDILDSPKPSAEGRVRPQMGQSAWPGFVLKRDRVRPGAMLTLENIDPEHPTSAVHLPKAFPRAMLGIDAASGDTTMRDLETRLNTIILSPDDRELVMIWAAVIPVNRKYSATTLFRMPQSIDWMNEGQGA